MILSSEICQFIFLYHFFRSLQIGRKYLGLRPYDKYDTSVDQIELALFEF